MALGGSMRWEHQFLKACGPGVDIDVAGTGLVARPSGTAIGHFVRVGGGFSG